PSRPPTSLAATRSTSTARCSKTSATSSAKAAGNPASASFFFLKFSWRIIAPFHAIPAPPVRPAPAGLPARRLDVGGGGADGDPVRYLGRAAHLRPRRRGAGLRLRLRAGAQPRRPLAAPLRPGPRARGRVLGR